MSPARVVLFGDPQGISQLLSVLGAGAQVLAMVQAAIRPAQRQELQALAAETKAALFVQPLPREAGYPGFIADMKALHPDLFLINSYSMILRPDLLALPARGAINIHGALLPQYRGASVTEWALIHEERTSGVTLHVMDAGIDTGPIVGQATVPLAFTDTWVDARQCINDATRGLLAQKMPEILAGRYSAVPQGLGRHWPRRSAKDGRFEWTEPLRQIYNLVRALVAPHPGAFWDRSDGTPRKLDRWMSLAELAALKAAYAGGWRYGDVALTPTQPEPEARRELANATITFEVRDASGVIGTAALRDIDCYGGTAGAMIRGCGATAAGAVTEALKSFLHDELQITRLDRVGALP